MATNYFSKFNLYGTEIKIKDEDAQSSASTALATANEAKTLATTAGTNATNAKTAADKAQKTADTAKTTADSAKSASTENTTNINKAKAEIPVISYDSSTSTITVTKGIS